MKNFLKPGFFAVSMVVTACSSSSPVVEPVRDSEQGSAESAGLAGAEYEAHVDVIKGTIDFVALPSAAALGGTIGTKGFKQVNSGNFKFTTNSSLYGASSSVPTATTVPVADAAGCAANQFCAQVRLDNMSGQASNDAWIEVTSITPDAGSVTIPSLGDAGIAKTGYSKPPTGYLDFTYGAFYYGDIASSGNATHNMRFDLAGGATSFTFKVRVLATFPRNAYSVIKTANAGVLFNACSSIATTGAVNTIFNDALQWDINSAGQTITLGFPFTIYGKTDTSAYATTNGLFGMGSFATSGSSGHLPSCSSPTVCSPTPVPRPALMPFWDDLKTRLPAESTSGGGACFAAGTPDASGARRFVFTWRDAYFSGNGDIPGSAGSHLTFSLRITEFTDQFEALFETMTRCTDAGCTIGANRHLGSNADIAVQSETGLSASTWLNNGSPGSKRLVASELPTLITFTPAPGDPVAIPR